MAGLRTKILSNISIRLAQTRKMVFRLLLLFAVAITVQGASEKLLKPPTETRITQKIDEKGDLNPASSSYSHQYSDWRGRYPSGYEFSVTGYGTIEDRVGANYGEISRQNNIGYSGNPGYSTGYGIYKGYDGSSQRGFESGLGGINSINAGYAGNTGYGNDPGNAGISGYGGKVGYDGYGGNIGYNGNAGYGGNGYVGNAGYSGSTGYGANAGYGGNGGYGGYGGNGGLTSYYGYNNPYYQGNNHLGYGYYNKRPGYGNIYNNGITPSLVTGYRGYSR